MIVSQKRLALREQRLRELGPKPQWWRPFARRARMALQDSYEMAPRLACGHWHRIEIPYTRLVANPSMRDALLDIFDDAADERSCYCVPMEAP